MNGAIPPLPQYALMAWYLLQFIVDVRIWTGECPVRWRALVKTVNDPSVSIRGGGVLSMNSRFIYLGFVSLKEPLLRLDP
jgi:hypothetical protein